MADQAMTFRYIMPPGTKHFADMGQTRACADGEPCAVMVVGGVTFTQPITSKRPTFRGLDGGCPVFDLDDIDDMAGVKR
jgi:hypothetical protein